MSGFDLVLLAVIILSAIAAAAHGFMSEVISLAGVVLGFLIASWQYWRIAPWFEQYAKSQALANAAAFLTIVAVVGLIAAVAAKITTWAVKEAGLRWIDRFLGGAFGVVRGAVLATVLVLVATSFTPDAAWLQRSTLAGYLTLSARVAIWVTPTSVRTKFYDGIAYLRKVRQDALAKADKTQAVERHD
jgi:membrane protein required for colicin V production